MPRPYTEVLARQQNVLWGDRYARTMAQALFTAGLHDTPTTFQAYVRKNPFDGAYMMTAGQNIVAEWLSEQWEVSKEVIDYLRDETVLDPATGKQKPLFSEEFLDMVQNSPLQLSIEAMPEGSLAFPNEPIFRVTGPAWQALWVETPITNSINSQTLLATLTSRVVNVANGQPVVENGLRRSHSIGGVAEARATFVGGATGTSNDQAGFFYQIPAYGTMAHAFVMFFDNEEESFRTYMKSLPQNATMLIDTYDTLKGVRNAVKVAKEEGVALKGVRLDSGDLAHLSREVRTILDEAGFTKTQIIGSNNLDEFKVDQIKNRENGAIELWALGTRLATTDMDNGPSHASLGAVYKLATVGKGLDAAGFNQLREDIKAGKVALDPTVIAEKIKLSEQPAKTSIPGEVGVVRLLTEDGMLNGSILVPHLAMSAIDPATGRLSRDITSVRQDDPDRMKVFKAGTRAYDPLRPMFAFGKLVDGAKETVQVARARGFEEMARLHPSHKRLLNPHTFVVGLEKSLYEKRRDMMAAIRNA